MDNVEYSRRLFLWEPQESNDSVNHPSHYQNESGRECIDEMEFLFGTEAVIAFCKCNVYKYRFRADKKNGVEDLKKANWYMDKLDELNGKRGKPDSINGVMW